MALRFIAEYLGTGILEREGTNRPNESTVPGTSSLLSSSHDPSNEPLSGNMASSFNSFMVSFKNFTDPLRNTEKRIRQSINKRSASSNEDAGGLTVTQALARLSKTNESGSANESGFANASANESGFANASANESGFANASANESGSANASANESGSE